MQIINDHNQVSWVLFPHNNNRTAYRPMSLPLILVEPNRRTLSGSGVANSGIFEMRLVIEDASSRSPVAGHDHVGLYFPAIEVFTMTQSRPDLSRRMIDISACDFFDPDGVQISYSEATFGDFVQYTTISGVRDTMSYIPTANYYDFSDYAIETDGLPDGHYFLSYQADYYARILTEDGGQLVCIDSSKVVTAVYRFEINHPGEILAESVRLTPQPYLTSAKRSEDSTIAFYRPFVDILQDIFDEQDLLKKVNWVSVIVPEYVPYLGYLLGMDIPFFPGSADRLRRVIIANAVRLQQLKGSRRAVLELFELFGYTIDIINLFWSTDGNKLIRPDVTMRQPYTSQSITTEDVWQVDPLLVDYATDGFGQITIPLLFRPTWEDELIINSYLVTVNSEIYTQLTDIEDALNSDPTDSGDQVQNMIDDIAGDGLIGFSSISVSSDASTSLLLSDGYRPPIIETGVRLSKNSNLLDITFDGSIDFASDQAALFVFASYVRRKINVPAEIQGLHSNRFDVRLQTRSGENVSSDVLNFLVEFLFRLKSFHSLLNVVIYDYTSAEVYQVTDMCVGGDVNTRPDTDLGQLQVPPPIIPQFGEDCDTRQETIGYKASDIRMRNEIMEALPIEHEAWKNLDSRAGGEESNKTRLEDVTEDPDRDSCVFNYRGQDIIEPSERTMEEDYEYSPSQNANRLASQSSASGDEYPNSNASNSDSSVYGHFIKDYTGKPTPLCNPEEQEFDYCFRGRVEDELLRQSINQLTDNYVNKACAVGIGGGLYYELPRALNNSGSGLLNKLLSAANPTDNDLVLHYVDDTFTGDITDGRNYIAIQRPSLNIDIPFMHFPGCRFPTLGRLTEDYVSSTIKARPWDDIHSAYCQSSFGCREAPSHLNATIVENTNGDFVLSFDDAPYTVYANGQNPDISSLGSHDIQTHFTADDIIRAIYTTADGGHEAIEMDTLDTTATTTIDVSSPIFGTAAQCEETGTGATVDFIDGYSSDSGYFNYTGEDLDRSGLYSELLDGLGVPSESGTGILLLFTLGSGILSDSGYRLDCGCSTTCGATNGLEIMCSSPVDLDTIEVEQSVVLTEVNGAREMLLDGTITGMFLLA